MMIISANKTDNDDNDTNKIVQRKVTNGHDNNMNVNSQYKDINSKTEILIIILFFWCCFYPTHVTVAESVCNSKTRPGLQHLE